MSAPARSPRETLLAIPGMQRVPSPRLELFMLRGFLGPDLCAGLIAQIEAQHRPSTVADFNGDSSFRTSSTCDIDPTGCGMVELEARFAAVSGFDRSLAEPVQGQRYEVGQEFKAHTDYFEPDGPDFARFCADTGQRTWTFMVYLNDVAAGGATRFKLIDKIVQPEAGKLLCWNNRLPDGSVNPATLHHALKVRKGHKYVITRWYRERGWPIQPT
jgi:prolyl 4-hydroxylase